MKPNSKPNRDAIKSKLTELRAARKAKTRYAIHGIVRKGRKSKYPISPEEQDILNTVDEVNPCESTTLDKKRPKPI